MLQFDDSYGGFLFALLTSRQLLNNARSLMEQTNYITADINGQFESTVQELDDLTNYLLQSMFRDSKGVADKVSDQDFKLMVERTKKVDNKILDIEARMRNMNNPLAKSDPFLDAVPPKKEMLN